MADCVSHNSAMLEIEGRDPFLLVIHVMPTSLRKENRDA